jgi:hypothetical protein
LRKTRISWGYDDESDVPVDLLISHVMSRGVAPLPAGFGVTEDGSLVRNGVAEDPEIDVSIEDLPLSIRRGKRTGKKNTLYSGDVWEDSDLIH